MAKEKAVKWVLIRLARYGCLILGGLLLLFGALFGVSFLISLGGLVVVVAILLFLA